MATPRRAEQVVTLPPSGIKAALRLTLNARRVPCIYGSPGIGKSDVVRQLADELYAPAYGLDPAAPPADRPYLVDLRGSLLDPVDLMGLPTVVDGRATFARPSWLPTDPRGGVIFLDELTRASVMVLNALLQFILDRRIGEHRIPDTWQIIAATNRVTDGGGVQRPPAALTERLVRLDMEPDSDEWSTWALGAGIHPLTVAFLRWKPDLFNAFDPGLNVNVNPRSWHFASDLTWQQPAPEIELALMAGTVGVGPAGEYLAFIRNFRSCPSPDAIILDPANAPVPGPNEPSSLFAISAALARKMDADNAEAIGIYLERMPTEYAAFAWKDAAQRDNGLTHTAAFLTFVVAHPEIN